jgi:transcriptional regulator GlxA family with amidase domain
MRYAAERRLQLAATLLRDTPMGVAAVAEAFNRAFKRALGSPPAQWRRRQAR